MKTGKQDSAKAGNLVFVVRRSPPYTHSLSCLLLPSSHSPLLPSLSLSSLSSFPLPLLPCPTLRNARIARVWVHQVSGIEGNFRITCENVMRILRSNKVAVLASLFVSPSLPHPPPPPVTPRIWCQPSSVSNSRSLDSRTPCWPCWRRLSMTHSSTGAW